MPKCKECDNEMIPTSSRRKSWTDVDDHLRKYDVVQVTKLYKCVCGHRQEEIIHEEDGSLYERPYWWP